jgi:hypothetical protein
VSARAAIRRCPLTALPLRAARSIEAPYLGTVRLFHRLRPFDLAGGAATTGSGAGVGVTDGAPRLGPWTARTFRLRDFRRRTRRKNPGPVELDAGVLVLERADRGLVEGRAPHLHMRRRPEPVQESRSILVVAAPAGVKKIRVLVAASIL